MKKEFIEYEGNTVPYRASEICFCLSDYARKYILERRSIIKNIDSDVRDAILVDLINYLGMIGGIDFALYSKDLYEDGKSHCVVDDLCLISAIYKNLSYYLYYTNPSDSIKLNNHMNKCENVVSFDDISFVVSDFLNYLFEVNDYLRVLSLSEMKDMADEIAHKIEMNKLKSFLESTNEYSEKLSKGASVDLLYRQMSNENKLDYIDGNDVYYYQEKIARKLGRREMFSWDIQVVKDKLYALCYAHGKINPNEKPKIEVLQRTIKLLKEN